MDEETIYHGSYGQFKEVPEGNVAYVMALSYGRARLCITPKRCFLKTYDWSY